MQTAILFIAAQVAINTTNINPTDECYVVLFKTLTEKLNPKLAKQPETSQRIAETIVLNARRYELSPEFLFSFAIVESDVDHTAQNITEAPDKIAIDGGLMGIRCILPVKKMRSQRCTNTPVRSITTKELFSIEKNIEVAAQYLQGLRDNPTRIPVIVDGKRKTYKCNHKHHGYWAHYNWGMRVFTTGVAAKYPHQIVNLTQAINKITQQNIPEIAGFKVAKASKRINSAVTKILGTPSACFPILIAEAEQPPTSQASKCYTQ